MEGGVTNVIIRTPDQRVKDIQVECQPTWTVANLKQHLSKLYPGNPTEEKQRLILAGKLLQDNTHLDEIFKMYEFQPILHFVYTQTHPEPATEAEPVDTARPTSSTPTAPPVEAVTTPVRPQLSTNPRWSAHVSQIHTWHQQLANNQTGHYPQQLAQPVFRRVAEQTEPEVQPEPQPPPQQPVQPRDEEEEPHDLLDVFYLIIRGLFLLALAWNYASPAKFCFMGVLLFYLYLYQGGYITLPGIFTSDSPDVEGDNAARQPSSLTLLRSALISFFTSLIPSNENNL